jgi:SAM-dependent methyltransferase
MDNLTLRRQLERRARQWEERGRRLDAVDVIAGYPEAAFAGRAEDVHRKLAPQAGLWLPDAGAGPGARPAALATDFSRVAAFDLAHTNLQKIPASNSRVWRVQGSVHRLPFISGAFDRVLCYGVLHCFPSWEIAAEVVRELARVCKPAGRLLLGDNEPLCNTAFSPPLRKQPVNVTEYDPELTYLCFEPAFFQQVLTPLGWQCHFEDTIGESGHFDVVVSRRPG